MAKEQTLLPVTLLDKLQSSGSGYDVLRYISLPNLLGSEANTLLYFLGKDLARNWEISTIDDLYAFFEKMGWGKLELVKEKRKQLVFNLMADSVANRINAPFPIDFRIEAGFLAETVQRLKGVPCECTEEINKKILQVEFSVILV